MSLKFNINIEAAIVGVMVNIKSFGHDETLELSITMSTKVGNKWTVIGTGDPKVTSLHREQMFYKINTTQSIAPYTQCNLRFQFATISTFVETYKVVYTLPENRNPGFSDGLA